MGHCGNHCLLVQLRRNTDVEAALVSPFRFLPLLGAQLQVIIHRSVEIREKFPGGASSCAVMQDGSRIEILNSEFVEPIDLEKLDYILLADGTKLPAPGN